jgi:lysophospholipase L1-like esterase
MPNALQRNLVPRALLLGAAFGFAVCCLAGRHFAHRNFYANFLRFHEFISPTTLHYPTASQVDNLARTSVAPDQTAVVIGGNSILFGVWQQRDRVWALRLQERLGPEFKVLNFGMPSALPAEFGATAAEMLQRRHPKVIFLTNFGTSSSPDDRLDGETYRYFFWDAVSKGLLPLGPARKERVRQLAQERRADPKTGPAFRAMQQGQGLDRWLYFQDLWTTASYRWLNTIWSPWLRERPLQARKRYLDPHIQAIPVQDRYQNGAGALATVRGQFASSAGSPARIVAGFEGLFPEPARRRTLVLLTYDSPFYLDQLEPQAKEAYAQGCARTVARLRQAGFAACLAGKGFTKADYLDRCHFSEEGGEKLADRVAAQVRDLARQLGYRRAKERP